VEHAALASLLTRVYSGRASKILFLKGAPEPEFHVVAEAIDTARGVNIDQVAFVR